MEKILEFLYYQTPVEYELMLGEAEDPNRRENSVKLTEFLDHMNQCSLSEYCQLIVKAFLIKYPSGTLRFCLLDFDDRGLFLIPDRTRRSVDIKRIDCNYKKAKLHGRFDPETLRNLEYLDEFKVNFKASQPDLASWLENALTGKAFSKTTNGSNTVFSVSNSPILTLEVDATSFTIFIDKNTFIEYLFQSRGYDDE